MVTVLKIHSDLDKGAVQCVVVCEAVLPEIVLHVTPSGLQPDVAGQLKFETARQLVAPVGAINRFSNNSAPLPVQLICSVSVGVKSADIAFGKNLRGFPDSHPAAHTDYGVDPVDIVREIQTLPDAQQLAEPDEPRIAIIEDA